MNPQFQNMMGMGRGMPTGNMQSMNMNVNNANNTSIQLQRYIMQTLQQEGPWTGWQAEVPIQERAMQIKQLVDSLRLLGPPVELQRAVEVALNFERKEFAGQQTKEDYQRECADKLSKIRDQRQQQLRQHQMNGNQSMGMINPNLQQQQNLMRQSMGVPQQAMSQSMQSSPMPAQNRPMQMPGMAGAPNMGQVNPMNQAANGMQQMGKATMGLSRDDNVIINQRAAEMAKCTPRDEMRNIVSRMDPRLQAHLAQKNIEPIIYHFRMLATKEFRQRQMQGNNAVPAQINNEANNNLGAIGQVQNGQQNGVNPAMVKTPAQSNATPFLSNYDHIRGQQEAGWKSQQEGQQVVPASNNQNMTPDQMRLQQQMMSNQRLNQQNAQMSQNFINQQQAIKAQQQQEQQRQLQAAQSQAQAQNQARGQVAAMQGQMGGMGQNNAINMLNRSVQPGLQNGSPQPARPQSRPAAPGAQPQTNPMMGQQLQAALSQNPQALLARLPPQLQNFLRTKPPNEWAALIQRWQQSQQAQQMRRSMSQQQPGQQTGQQPGQQAAQSMNNNQMLGPSPLPMQQSLSAGQPGQTGNTQTPEFRNAMPNMNQQQQSQNMSMTPNPELMRQRQLQMQAQQQRLANGQQAANNAELLKRPLQPAELQFMDNQIIHPTVVQQLQGHFAQQNIFWPGFKNWMHLKQWLTQNPVPKLVMPIVMSMQANQFHYQNRLKNQHNAARMASATGQSQIQQQLPQQQQQQQQQSQPQPQPQPQVQPQQTPQQQQQFAQSAQQSAATAMGPVPGMRPITDQDIQRIRQQNPKVAPMTDDQIRQFMMTKLRQQQQQALAQQQQQKGQAQQAFMQQQNQVQAQNQNSVPAPNQPPQPTSQQAPAQAQQQTQQPQALNRTQPGKQQGSVQNQPPQPIAGQQRTLKRPNQDDNTESSTSNPAAARPQIGEQQKPSIPNLTKEQFAKLSDTDKQKYMIAMRVKQQRAELQRRITELNKQVQSQTLQLRPIVNMDPASRKRIIGLLSSDAAKSMLNRFEMFLMAYCNIENNETTLKQLISNRNLLIAQYKQNTVADKTWEPADNFSISADNVESIISNMSTKFQQTMVKSTQRPQNQASQQPQGQPGQQQQMLQQSLQNQQSQQSLPLTTENLNLAQAQALQQSKKNTKKDIPPAAPIATQPPFQIGDSRGQGTPRYAPNVREFKPEDLKIDPKRRKKTHGATPTNAVASPDITQESKPVPKPFKCNFVGCEYQSTGFTSRAELEQHTKVAHKPELEPVTDPLAFLDSSLMQAFDLDSGMQSKRKVESTLPMAQPMQKNLSKAGSNLKIESKPSTPVPMSRGLSQQMGKTNASGTPNMLKTPQSMKAETKNPSPKAGDAKEEPDLWAVSNFSLDTLRDTFGDMEWNDVMPTMDPEQVDLDDCVQTYMQSDEWQKVMNGGVLPTSSDGSTDKSKSPGEGSEQSATAGDAQKPSDSTKQTADIDLSLNDINIDPDGFEDLIMTESQMYEMDDSTWEKIEKPSPGNKQEFSMPDPFASLDDPDFDAWSKPLYEPLQANGFPDTNSPFEPIDLDEFVAMNGPEVWAAGSMDWNAVGEAGEKARKELGWPVEGAHGFKK